MKFNHFFLCFHLLLLVGCEPASNKQSQIIATVNGDEISVHQLSFAINRGPMKVLGESDRSALIESLIDRQLLVQQALAHELDRQPEVMMQLEEARLQVLAAAYAMHVVQQNPQTRDTDQAAVKYYSEHPALFEKRKIYKLREIAIPVDSPSMQGAEQRLQQKENLETIIQWLKQQPGRFSDQFSVRPADHLPVEVADKLLPVKPGETISFKLPRALTIYQLQSTEPAPLDLISAKPMIEKYLKAQREKTLNQIELNRLRTAAQITRQQTP